ncbi:hypothetical protein Gohar_003620, partial [Gossypium harknessii]|nr:hypothetical protein [Gossypium harknessii]
ALPIFLLFLSYVIIRSAEQCGRQAGGALCPRVQRGPAPGPGRPTNLISRETFDWMLLHGNDRACPARGFYTYDAFIAAASSFLTFATTGDQATRKREIAAFLAQTAHETTGGGGWAAPDGPYAWGYCYNKELNVE